MRMQDKKVGLWLRVTRSKTKGVKEGKVNIGKESVGIGKN